MTADHSHAATGGDLAAEATAEHFEHVHPTWKTYRWVALILTLITVGEVWIYYVPAVFNSPFFVPTLLILSTAKFAIVVMFYMHLKYDSKVFRALFTGPLAVAITVVVSLLFLFGHLAIRLRGS